MFNSIKMKMTNYSLPANFYSNIDEDHKDNFEQVC